MLNTLRAHVRSIERMSTPQGQRFYCVFEISGRPDLAFWSPDVGQFDDLTVGSEVNLIDNGGGRVSFDPQAWKPQASESNWLSHIIGSFL
ncbi:MAG: hypothetical protein HC795_14230 [Coleofasciculaceae cyanobacterium RL_1_1]|nr:hypothetical protein [Coleofasciculaceae cyanobacterium RL_1_1]